MASTGLMIKPQKNHIEKRTMTSNKSTFTLHTEVQLAQEIRRFKHLVNLFPDDCQSSKDSIVKLEEELDRRLTELTCKAFESLNS
jgi:hypothetical protein